MEPLPRPRRGPRAPGAATGVSIPLGVPRGHCGPDPCEALGSGWQGALRAPASRRDGKAGASGRKHRPEGPPSRWFFPSAAARCGRVLSRAWRLFISLQVAGKMSETPLRTQVELGACQLSLPPRRCGRGPSRGEGCPARGVQALVSQAPSCSHSQEPSRPQEGALARDVA